MAPSGNITDAHHMDGCYHDEHHLVGHQAFLHIYLVMVFIAAIWIVGRISTKIGLPDLVGQIIVGILLGPEALNILDSSGNEFLIVIGEIGLIMLVVEAGLDVDIGMIKLIGPRGLMVAIFGSFVPLLIGFGISMLLDEPIQSSIAIGACFAPTSMGIALNVLKKAKILNTPTGQLIIAAAILDDVIALMLLSELKAISDPTVFNVLLPIIVSPLLILFIGYLSIRYIPRCIKYIMNKIPQAYHENSILMLLFLSAFVLIPACQYAGSSHLLGAFLAGLMFCTDHTVHHAWNNQIKRILNWMLKIFFACSIGFAIPVGEFANATVIGKAALYCISAVGKIATGMFAKPRKQKDFLTVAFSMSAWGEFAFILATASFEEGTIDMEAFSSVLLAVMVSVIVSPYALRLTVNHYAKRQMKKLDKHLTKYGTDDGHPVYYAIITKARGSWGHQDKLLHIIFEHKLSIIDFRAWHAPEYNYSHHKPLTKESFYVQDLELILPPTKYLNKDDKKSLHDRVKGIREAMKKVLGNEATVVVKRWLPGLKKCDDKKGMTTQDIMRARRASYCRREAFKQAHSIMSYANVTEVITQELNEERKKFARMNGTKAVTVNGQTELLTELKKGRRPSSSKSRSKNVKFVRPRSGSKSVGFGMSQLVRAHSGAGHGGQAKGVGAVPITNNIIDIHDHFGNSDTDDSTSYVYADEDAEHHHLPEYTDYNEYSRADNSRVFDIKKTSIDPTIMPTIDDDEEMDGEMDGDMDLTNKKETLKMINTNVDTVELDIRRQISDYNPNGTPEPNLNKQRTLSSLDGINTAAINGNENGHVTDVENENENPNDRTSTHFED